MRLSSRKLRDEHRRAVVVTHQYTVVQGNEQAVAISVREYDRLIERLEACKQRGWADLWLAGAGAGVAVAAAALVGALTSPGAMSGTRAALWVAAGCGMIILLLCLLGYFGQRRDHGREIAELRKDLENHKPDHLQGARPVP